MPNAADAPDAVAPEAPAAPERSATWKRVLRAAAGFIVGFLAGAATTLALLALRAAIFDSYIHGVGEVVGWLGLPVVVAPLAGAALGFFGHGGRAWRTIGVVFAALAAGTVVGVPVGNALSPDPSGPWAGALAGASLGALAAMGWASIRLVRRPSPATAVAVVGLAAFGFACAPPDAPDDARIEPAPDPERVEAVLYLLGDPGVGRMDHFPVLPQMRRDMEAWSEALDPEAEVAMAVLGDIVYPDGLHPATDPTRTTDSLRIADQIAIVSTRAADRQNARGWFIAGNHDWGKEEDWEGAIRLARLDAFLQNWSGRAEGRVSLVPGPGKGGPTVIDLGEHLRLVILDTAWWLLGAGEEEKDAVMEGVREALESAGERRVVMAAHHPLESGGPHGTFSEMGSTLGLRFLLREAGILLQDLDSKPYQEFLRRLDGIFEATGGPDVFAGGHEHSLQVFEPQGNDVTRNLVVGSASKLTGVGMAPHMLFGRSEPGYGKIFALDDGSLHIRVEAAPTRYLRCDRGADESQVCMGEALNSFRTVWAETLE